MDTSSLTRNQTAAEQAESGTNRLPAGSTLEIQPGIRVPHPEAAPTPAGIVDPRITGDAVNELLDGTQTVLKDRGALGKDEDGDGIAEVNTAVKPKGGSSPMELWQGQNALPASTNPYLAPEERARASQSEAAERERVQAEQVKVTGDDASVEKAEKQ
jgi:hypothetical protein